MGFLAIVRHSIYLAFNPVVMQLTCCMQKKTAGRGGLFTLNIMTLFTLCETGLFLPKSLPSKYCLSIFRFSCDNVTLYRAIFEACILQPYTSTQCIHQFSKAALKEEELKQPIFYINRCFITTAAQLSPLKHRHAPHWI